MSYIHFKKAHIYSQNIQSKKKSSHTRAREIGESYFFVNLICVFSEVEITMNNLGLTFDGVCKPLKSFVKIFNLFEFQGIL